MYHPMVLSHLLRIPRARLYPRFYLQLRPSRSKHATVSSTRPDRVQRTFPHAKSTFTYPSVSISPSTLENFTSPTTRELSSASSTRDWIARSFHSTGYSLPSCLRMSSSLVSRRKMMTNSSQGMVSSGLSG